MKLKIFAGIFFLLVSMICFLPPVANATTGFIKPTSKLYFIQTLAENVNLSLRFSKQSKLNYALSLTEKRVNEIEEFPSSTAITLYEKNYQYLNKLASSMGDSKDVSKKIEESSFRQQKVLARVYNGASEAVKGEVLGVQEDSSKQVSKTIERAEGSAASQDYAKRVDQIIRLEKIGKIDQIERVQMEESPNSNPSTSTPRQLNELNQINSGQNLNTINSGQGGGQGEAPAGQIQMEAPAGRN